MVGVFLLLSHLASVRDHGLEVVRIPVIPRLDGMGTAATDELIPLGHLPSDHDDVDDYEIAGGLDSTAGGWRVQRDYGRTA